MKSSQTTIETWRRGTFEISTDRDRLERSAILAFLRPTYWARDVPDDVIWRSVEHALPFGLYDLSANRQIGFARAITDYARFAWLSDVIILDAYRGGGLGAWLVETVLAHPALANIRTWLLSTDDAHGLYAKCGFKPLEGSTKFMIRSP